MIGSSSVSSVVVGSVLQSLFQLSKSKARCSAALQAIAEGRCLKSSQQDDAVGSSDANLVIIATFLINRTIDALRSQSDQSVTATTNSTHMQHQSRVACAVVLAAMSHSLSTVLLIDRARLERVMNQLGKVLDDDTSEIESPALTVIRTKITSDSKIILGRAFLSSVMGALAAMETLCRDGTDQPCVDVAFAPFIRNALVSSFLALEMLTKFHVKPPTIGTHNTSPIIAQTTSKHTTEKGSSASSSVTPFHLSPVNSKTNTQWNQLVKAILSDFDIRFLSKQVPWSGRVGEEDSGSQLAICRSDEHLSQICALASAVLFDHNDDIASLLGTILTLVGVKYSDFVTSVAEASSAPPKKRARVSAKKQAAAPTATLSEPSGLDVATQYLPKAAIILLGLSSSNFDTKLPFRKWASSALVWFSDGQKIILNAAIHLLHVDSLHTWQKVMVGDSLDSIGASSASVSSDKGSEKKPTKKRKSIAANKQMETIESGRNNLRGNVALMAYVLKLIDLVCDIGRVGDAPDLGLQSYVSQLSLNTFCSSTSVKPPDEQKARGRRNKNSKVKDSQHCLHTRSLREMRDEVTVLIRYLLVAHNCCIRDNIALSFLNASEGNGLTDYLLLNDDFVSTDHHLSYCPNIVEAIYNLASFASVSSHPWDSDDTRNRIIAIGCSLATAYGQVLVKREGSVMIGSKNVIVVDARVSSMAIEFLSRCCNAIISEVENIGLESKPSEKASSDGLRSDQITEMYGLQWPLFPLLNPQSLPSDQRHTETDSQSHGKHVRTVNLADGPDYAGVYHRSIGTLPWNGEIVALFVRTFKSVDNSIGESTFKLFDAIFRILAVCYSLICSKTPSLNKACVLSTDCLNLMHYCFKAHGIREKNGSLGTDVRLLELLSRFCLSTCSLSTFIRLGSQLNQNMLCRLEPDEVPAHGSKVSAIDDTQCNLTLKKLWESHVQLSKVIGRAASYLSPDLTGMIDCDVINILKLIADASSISTNRSPNDNASEYDTKSAIWPLRLPSIHQCLVLSYLDPKHPNGNRAEKIAEFFLCESILVSLENAFDEMKEFDVSQSNGRQFLRRDASILILSVGQLASAEQLKILSRLINLINCQVKSICKDEKLKQKFYTSRRLSSFVARLITVTATLIDIVCQDDLLCNHLSSIVGSMHYPFPSRTEIFDNPHDCKSELGEKKLHSWSISFSEDETLDAWFDLSPYLSGTYKINFIPESDKVMYRSTLEILIEIGLEAARFDGCHLMFSIWNACARSDFWYARQWTGVLPLNQFLLKGNGAKLIGLRKDLCFLYSETRQNSNTNSASFYDKIYKQSRNSNIDVSRTIKDGVSVVIGIIHSFLGVKPIDRTENISGNLSIAESLKHVTAAESYKLESNKADMHGNFTSTCEGNYPSALDCCVFEMVASFISFLSSSFTTRCNYPDEISFSDSDDDRCIRDDDSCLEARIKLHGDCEYLGISPFHPDTLDSSCNLRVGISRSEAAKYMNDLILALLLSGRWAMKNFTERLEDAIPKGADVSGVSLLPLLYSKSTPGRYHELETCMREGYKKDLVECIANFIPTGYLEDAARHEFVRKSATLWIRGQLHEYMDSDESRTFSMAELRTSAEWEMLFAEALVGASCVVETEIDANVSDLLLRSVRWKRILTSVLNALVTTIGLFRYCLCNEDKDSPECNYLPMLSEAFEEEMIIDVLAFMADVATCAQLDSSIKKIAKSIATTLLLSESDFSSITSTFSSIKLLSDISMTCFACSERSAASSKSIRLLDMLIPEIDSLSGNQILSSLCYNELSVAIITGKSVNMLVFLPYLIKISSAYGDNLNVLTYRRQLINSCLSISMNASVISYASQLKVLSFFERGIKAETIESSQGVSFIGDLLYLWNQVNHEQCRSITEQILCVPGDFQDEQKSVHRKLCFVIGSIIACSDATSFCDPSLSFYRLVVSFMNRWTRRPGFDHLIYLVCIIALRYDVSEDVVQHLSYRDDVDEITCQCHYYVNLFFDFLEGLEGALDLKLPDESIDNSFKKWGIQPITKRDVLERRCTFAQTGEDFTVQHWYNCYTCGLKWDRGCCTICALLCHTGHDVGYSRLSAFFCDCGAESSSSLSCSKLSPPCRCLRISSSSKGLIEDYKTKINQSISCTSGAGQAAKLINVVERAWENEFFYVASKINSSLLRKNLNNIIDEVIRARFASKLLKECSLLATCVADRINEHVSLCRSPTARNDHIECGTFYPNSNYESVYCSRYDHLQMQLRVGAKSIIGPLTTEPFKQPLRASSVNLSSIKYMGGRPNITSRATSKSYSSSRRDLIVADNHARLFIAEAYRVSFCSAISLMNTMSSGTYCDSAIERNTVGAQKVDFMIVGLKISKDNDRHVLVYGLSGAVVLVMNEHCTKVEAKIDLTLGPGNSTKTDNDIIVHSEWLPGSLGAVVLIYFNKQILIYDLRRSLGLSNATDNSFSCMHTARYSITKEDMMLASGALIPKMPYSGYDHGFRNGYSSMANEYLIICLFQTGQVQCIEMATGSKGEIQDQGELSIEVEFKERMQFTNPTPDASYHITYLTQSSLLLYQSTSSPVQALVLDQDGTISGDFELLPNIVNNGIDITGPFLNWTELGIVTRDEMWFYRALCIGKCLSSNHEVLLYIEFNRYKSTVKNIALTATSFEGISALSVEVHGNQENEPRDTIILSALRSDGSLFMLEENSFRPSYDMVARFDDSRTKKMSHETMGVLTIFENLLCVSNNEACVIHSNSERTDNDNNARKLIIGNREFSYSSTKPSYNFALALKGRSENDEICKEDYAIVAIRVLVGSSTLDSIPDHILLMGKHLQLPKSTKRYQDFILNEKEIIDIIRNGYLTISIPSSIDSRSTFIDGIEVYVLQRDGMTFLGKDTSWVGWDFNRYIRRSALDFPPDDKFASLENIFSSIIIVSRLLKSLGHQVTKFPNELLSVLVRIAIIDPRDRISLLIKELTSDQNSSIIDEASIQGITDIMSFFEDNSTKSESSTVTIMEELTQWHQTCMINKCIRLALDILRERPLNFFQYALKHFPGKINTSLARIAKDWYDAKHTRNCTSIYQNLMMLGLSEAALTMEQFSSPLPIKASSCLDVIYELIHCHGKETFRILKRFIAERRRDWFDAQTEAAYCCDACDCFPIRMIRYTHRDMRDIDICSSCYEASYLYSKSNNFSCNVPAVFINGQQLHFDGRPINCSEIPEMKPIPVSHLTIDPLGEINNSSEQLDDTLKNITAAVNASKSQELKLACRDKKDFYSELFGIILKAALEVLSPESDNTQSGGINQLFDLILFMIESADNKDRDFLKKSIYSPVVQKMALMSISIPWQLSLLTNCVRFLESLITIDRRTDVSNIRISSSRQRWVESDKGFTPFGVTSVIADRRLAVKIPKEVIDKGVAQDICFIIASTGNLQTKLCTSLRTNSLDSNDCSNIFTIVSDARLLEAVTDSDRNSTTSTKVNFDISDGSLHNIALLYTRRDHHTVLECESAVLNGTSMTPNNTFYVDTVLSLMCLLFESIDPVNVSQRHGLHLDCWLAPLCELIVSRSEHMDKATRALKALCALMNYSYSSAIDRHIFESCFTQLLQNSLDLLEAAFAVRDKAQQFQYHRIEGQEPTRDDLNFSSFIGVNDLLSEETFTIDKSKKVGKTLQQLIDTVTASETPCWSDFCLSESSEKLNVSVTTKVEPMRYLLSRPRICLLFWLGCLMTGSNQVKTLKLIEVAISTQRQDESRALESDGTSDSVISHGRKKLFSLSLDNVYSFVLHFSLYGDSELREITAKISQFLILALDDSSLSAMIARLTTFLLRNIGPRGCESIEFIKLLQNIVNSSRVSRGIDVRLLAKVLTTAFVTQSQLSCPGKHSIRKTDDTVSDRLCCWSCLRSNEFLNTLLTNVRHKFDSTNRSSSSHDMHELAPSPSTVSELSKYRLDSIADRSTFTAFASYFQLKTRIDIHELSVTISDPRGRYVKKIEVYFSSRPVENTSILKMPSYNCWQLCGTFLLNRGGSCARTTLEIPVTASNLKIEYKELFERNENHRKSDSSSSVLCPRCTNLVTNSHGVCNLCGDVAFQCRRCRHINYERLDAFLCVECGYCANGSFSFEVKGIWASKAVAILDDEDVSRSIIQLQSLRRIASSTRSLLNKKYAASDNKSGDDIFGQLYDKHLSNALLGKTPSIHHGLVESSNRGNNPDFLDVSERVRSLLNIARSTRSITGENSNQDSDRAELLFHQALLSSRLLSDTMEPAESDLSARILDIGDTHDFTSDLFTRILRRVSDRDRSKSIIRVSDETAGAETGKPPTLQASYKETVEETKKNFNLHRGAVIDCYDINRKLATWMRLNRNGLMGLNYVDSNPVTKLTYIPTSCPHCSSVLSYHMLVLLKMLFSSRSEDVRAAFNADFVGSLFAFGDDRHSELSDLKRSFIITLATDSSAHAEIVIDILKKRLSTGDRECADILGNIIVQSSSQAFVRLAIDTLEML